GIPNPTEQVLGWLDRPVLRGDELKLSIREEVARASALAVQNYVLSSGAARIRGVVGYEVRTDAKSGSRRTLVALRVDIPPSARRGLSVRARNLRAQGLEFLGAQKLPAVQVAEP